MSLAVPAAGPVAGPPPKPRLRGLLHLIAFPVSLVAGAVLVAMAEPGAERWGCVVYALASAVLFGVSTRCTTGAGGAPARWRCCAGSTTRTSS